MKTLQAVIEKQAQAILDAAAQAVDEEAKALKAKHDESVLNWEKRPKFDVKPSKVSGAIGRQIIARDAEIWSYVNYGTGIYGEKGQPYLILPVNAPALRFQTGYQAKTQPVANGNVGNGQRNGKLVSAQAVLHPGIEPRAFAEFFGLEAAESMPTRISQSIRRALRR